MFVLTNRNDPELSETNSRARLSLSKQLLKNIHRIMLLSFLFIDKKMFTVTTPKNPQNDGGISINHKERRRDKAGMSSLPGDR